MTMLRRALVRRNGGRPVLILKKPAQCPSVWLRRARYSGLGFRRRTTPTFLSTVAILLFAPGFNSLLLMIFSTANTTPSLHLMPIDVPPFSTAFTAYSALRRSCQPVPVGVLESSGAREAYLEIPTVGGEDRVCKVITCPDGCLAHANH